jgi:asparagine synthase (glutamine-hydrolysing)
MKMPKQNSQLMSAWKERWPLHFLNQESLEAFNLEANYFASATYDERFKTVNEAALYLLSRPFLPTRLENCSQMASAYGIEYAWPLLDQRLIQQWLSTPVIWKVGDGGIGRFLHRSAVAGVCPDKVAWKPSKDMGYAQVSNYVDTIDNRPLFHQALALLIDLPVELNGILDTVRIRDMANSALVSDHRGLVVRTAWSAHINQLNTLTNWLLLQS